jgi:hypothetical protein
VKLKRLSIFRIVLLSAGLCSLSAALSASENEVTGTKHFDPNIELPQSKGRDLVLRACTRCHELGGLSAYEDYWRFPQWKAMVENMVKNGAVLLPDEQDVVAEYLARHFSPDTKR